MLLFVECSRFSNFMSAVGCRLTETESCRVACVLEQKWGQRPGCCPHCLFPAPGVFSDLPWGYRLTTCFSKFQFETQEILLPAPREREAV